MLLSTLLHIAQRWISGEILRKSIISNPTERIVLTILDENNFCLCSHGGTRTQYAKYKIKNSANACPESIHKYFFKVTIFEMSYLTGLKVKDDY